MNLVNTIAHSEYDIFKNGQNTNLFIGRPFYLDFNIAKILVADSWKHKVKGIPEGCFLLAFYDNPYDEDINEVLLLRVLKPTSLPTDNIVVSSLIEYYKDNLNISGKSSDLDDFTRYEFSFSGLECRVLGTFYMNKKIEFGADVENFYAANNYKIYKATDNVLAYIVNQRDSDVSFGGDNEFPIGKVRYSSSRRNFLNDNSISSVEVYINPHDMLGKRTALFGMTRTGKSNTVKKIIEATSEISNSSINNSLPNKTLSTFEPIDKQTGKTLYKVGQLIFDINGEYANANLQDEGTAIFDMYKNNTIRYSTIEKGDDFRVMKVNFYNDILAGFDLVKGSLQEDNSDYIKSLLSIDFDKPENYKVNVKDKTSDERIAAIEYDKKVALYKCCLFKAGFPVPNNLRNVKFYGDVNTINTIYPTIEPHKGITLEQATTWFETIYDAMQDRTQFDAYRSSKDREYFDEDMLALLKFLTRKNRPGATPTVSGFRKIRSLSSLHTDKSNDSFELDIISALREGKIVIVDLSQGQPSIQKLYSEKICRGIFQNSMNRFINSQANNFIQFYFEEAHNLFPQKEDKDLSQVYNRIAKEGAKLNLGMIYATQEVSSISSNILKNTQNWFIAHLNNDDETKELKKFYDFSDFTSSLIKFSAKNDKGFVRMKTYSNPFVVPVQIDRFSAK